MPWLRGQEMIGLKQHHRRIERLMASQSPSSFSLISLMSSTTYHQRADFRLAPLFEIYLKALWLGWFYALDQLQMLFRCRICRSSKATVRGSTSACASAYLSVSKICEWKIMLPAVGQRAADLYSSLRLSRCDICPLRTPVLLRPVFSNGPNSCADGWRYHRSSACWVAAAPDWLMPLPSSSSGGGGGGGLGDHCLRPARLTTLLTTQK